MFDIGWSELAVIGVIALLVLGPNELPKAMRTVGQWIARARRMASHFQSGVDEMIRQAELDEIRKDARAMQDQFKRDLTLIDPPAPVPPGPARDAPEPPKPATP